MKEVFVIDGENEREVEVQLKAVRRRLEEAFGPVSFIFIS